MKEREAAKKLFSGKKGELLKKDIAAKRSKTFEVKDVVVTKDNNKPSTVEDQEFIQEKYKDQEAIKVILVLSCAYSTRQYSGHCFFPHTCGQEKVFSSWFSHTSDFGVFLPKMW